MKINKHLNTAMNMLNDEIKTAPTGSKYERTIRVQKVKIEGIMEILKNAKP